MLGVWTDREWEGHSWKWEGKSARGMDRQRVGGAQLEMGDGGECGRGTAGNGRWWGVWEGHSWKWEMVGSVGGAQLEMGGKEC